MSPKGNARRAESSLARSPEEESVDAASQEAPPGLRRGISESEAIIHIQESHPRMDAILDKARVTEEKPTKASQAVDEAINSFFEGVDVDMLEDYSSFGHLGISKRVMQPGECGLSSSSKLQKQFLTPNVDPDKRRWSCP